MINNITNQLLFWSFEGIRCGSFVILGAWLIGSLIRFIDAAFGDAPEPAFVEPAMKEAA